MAAYPPCPPWVDSAPLTFAELREMAVRYATHAEIARVVEQAMKRRLAELGKKSRK